MPVTFDEIPGSPVYAGTASELRATRVGLIPWGSIDAYYLELFPAAIAGVPQLPALCPGSSSLYAESVEFKPYSGDTGATFVGGSPSTYDQAEVTVQYKTIPYSSESNQIVTRRISMSGEFLVLPNRGLQWSGTPPVPVKGEDLNAGKIIATLEHQLTFHRVPVPNYADIRALIGKVNDGAFEGAAAGTLLFLGAEFRQEVTTDGSHPWEVDQRFMERRINGDSALGWNYFFRPDTGTWEQLETVSGDPIYDEGDFDSLF